MKNPFSVVIIQKDASTQRESQVRFDTTTGSPAWTLFTIWLKFTFSGKNKQA